MPKDPKELAFLKAAEVGGIEEVKSGIADGIPIHITDDGANTALHLASYRGHPEIVKVLLDNSADPTLGNENKDQPLHLAALANRVPCVHMLLSPDLTKKPDVEAHDAQGYCPLHYASGEGHEDVLEALITVGKASCESRNLDGLTPLMCGVQQGHVGVVKKLLAHDPPSLEYRNKSGDTALHYATISEGGLEMLTLLLRCGADPNAQNKEGRTPLYEAILEKKQPAVDLLQKIMERLAESPAAQGADRIPLIAEVLDGKYAGSGAKAVDVPAPSATAIRTKSRFSSQRAQGLRAKTSIEVAKEERQQQQTAGAAPAAGAGAAKPKSRIVQPSSSAAFKF
eukprot:CAMPEP_0196745196 /NCGR_PEP_ID=MMETSP1091-20130531/60541_1 /TAXON_ID=302021 /ORGANISM="Rhodomonas sp., Strain CCMP768" /LENGTH=339 /DNA_ID=CAMNT_0042091917 /DNA_START=1 /DNA_END=1020 /DNA_ORIENTATION=+